MKHRYLPVLGILRELYLQPRTMRRFRKYVDTLTGGSGDVVLPIGVANPMAKEHALTRLDELLALGAGGVRRPLRGRGRGAAQLPTTRPATTRWLRARAG